MHRAMPVLAPSPLHALFTASAAHHSTPAVPKDDGVCLLLCVPHQVPAAKAQVQQHRPGPAGQVALL